MMREHRKPLILVADDDHSMRASLREAIEKAGFAVVETDNGHRAIDAFTRLHPDLVVLDVAMPGPDGYQVCSLIREMPQGAAVPIVALTGPNEPDSIERAFESGATDFSPKHVNLTALLHRIKWLIRAKETADALRRSEARLASAHRMAQIGSWEYDPRTGRLEGSEELHGLLGAPPGSLHTLQDLLARVHSDDREAVRQAVMESEIMGQARTFRHRAENADGSVRHLWGQVEPGVDFADGLLLLGTVQNDTDRVLAREQIQSMAYYDSLTGLPNRAFLKRQLSIGLAHSRRKQGSVAVLFLDVDHFKHVNDSLGHSAGDSLLQALADRLSKCLRASDTMARYGASGPDSTVSRFGGDEFVILLTDLARWEHAVTVVRRVFDSLQKPFMLGEQEVFVTISVGISLFPADGNDPERLLKNADAAMHHAKDEGRNGWKFYNVSMNESSGQRLSLESSLRKALSRDEFLLHYQPQVKADDGRIVGVEVLIRWNREGGLVSPTDFIPIAEDTGLIVPIGEWALRTACLQAQKWREAGLGDLKVSVNLSPRQFQKESTTSLMEVIQSAGLDHSSLELEITEGVLCVDAARTVRILNDFKAVGARICIDDFGTGYSSLSYLKLFPIDTLKIDRSFVRDIKPGGEASLTLAIINLAHSLHLDLVAEGVENSEQKDFLLQEGCPIMQGYFFSRPVPVLEMTKLLEERRRGIPASNLGTCTVSE